MKVNLSLEVTDPQRNVLARLIVGKEVKRLATRDEVREFVAGMIAGLTDSPRPVRSDLHDTETSCQSSTANEPSVNPLSIADPEDAEVLAGKPPGYIIGWNRVKRKLGART